MMAHSLLAMLAFIVIKVPYGVTQTSYETKSELPINLTIVSKRNGIKYYDLSDAEELVFKVPANDDDVQGLTATSGVCQVEELILRSGYIIDKEIFRHCKRLKNFTLEGNIRMCSHDWSWMDEQKKKKGLTIHTKDAKCSNFRCPMYCDFQQAQDIIKEKNIDVCPELCICDVDIMDDTYSVHMRCENVSLTDDLIDSFSISRKTISLRLAYNKLRSTDRLFDKLGRMDQLEYLDLGSNHLETLPLLMPNDYPSLDHLELVNNKMEQLDQDRLTNLLMRESKDMVFTLHGNPFKCDCNFYRNKELIIKLMTQTKTTFYEVHSLPCTNPTTNETMVMKHIGPELCPKSVSHEIDWWLVVDIFLGMANLLFFYFIYDLVQALRASKGKISQRRPKLDIIICKIKQYTKSTPANQRNKRWKGSNEGASSQSLITFRNTSRRKTALRRKTPMPIEES